MDKNNLTKNEAMSYIQCILYLFYFCVFFLWAGALFCFGCVFVFFCFLAFIVGHKLRHLLVPFGASKKRIPKLKYIICQVRVGGESLCVCLPKSSFHLLGYDEAAESLI